MYAHGFDTHVIWFTYPLLSYYACNYAGTDSSGNYYVIVFNKPKQTKNKRREKINRTLQRQLAIDDYHTINEKNVVRITTQ